MAWWLNFGLDACTQAPFCTLGSGPPIPVLRSDTAIHDLKVAAFAREGWLGTLSRLCAATLGTARFMARLGVSVPCRNVDAASLGREWCKGKKSPVR